MGQRLGVAYVLSRRSHFEFFLHKETSTTAVDMMCWTHRLSSILNTLFVSGIGRIQLLSFGHLAAESTQYIMASSAAGGPFLGSPYLWQVGFCSCMDKSTLKGAACECDLRSRF